MLLHIVNGADQATATPSGADLGTAEEFFIDGDELKMYKQMTKRSGGSKLERAGKTTIHS